MATKADRYEGIDGLKAYAIIGIALMHVLSNGKYEIGGCTTVKALQGSSLMYMKPQQVFTMTLR